VVARRIGEYGSTIDIGAKEVIMIRTPEQYVESLRDGRVVYQDGEKIEDVPTRYKRSVERAASEFFVASHPEHRELFTIGRTRGFFRL